jgi:hypothetical protein
MRPRALAVLSALLLSVLLLALPSAARADDSGGLTVAPARVDVDVALGGSQTTTLTILNTFDSAMTFSIGTEDIVGSRSDPQSTPILLGGQVDSPISGADWVHPAVGSIRVDSGDTATVKVTVSVPSGATAGGHYAAVTVSTPNLDLGGDLHGTSRVAVPFLINAGNTPPPELTITDVTTHSDGTTTVSYVNKGVRAASPEGTITWVDPITGRTLGTTKASTCSTALPDAKGECQIPGLGDGKDGAGSKAGSGLSKGNIVLVNGGEKGAHARASTPTQWSGSWTSLILPFVGLSLFVLYFARLRRRDDDEEDEDDLYAAGL